MSKNTVQGVEKRAFTKQFMALCNWNAPWERWNDMLWLFSTAISNTVDPVHAKEREEVYRNIAQKYSESEMRGFVSLFDAMVAEYDRDPFQDFLGSIFMELELGNSAAGQFFTPYSVCQMMAKMSIDETKLKEIDENGWIGVNDCASGAGAMLIAAAERLHQMGINYQTACFFVAQDLDSTVAMMCYLQLSMLGCPGYVRIGDTLTDPTTGNVLFGDGSAQTWYTPMYFRDVWTERRTLALIRGLEKQGRQEHPKEETGSSKKTEPKAEKKPRIRKEGRRDDDGGQSVQLSFF